MPVGAGVWQSKRGTFSIIYYCLPPEKLKEKLQQLDYEAKHAACPADIAIAKIHLNLCTKMLKETMADKISVLGLGKLGAPMAACLASKGFEVLGVDVDLAKVDAINAGEPPVSEVGLDELLKIVSPKVSAVRSISEAVQKTDITFVVTATPSEPSGRFSLKYILPACEEIGKALREKAKFHVVAITSTVMPGDCDGLIKQTLESASGKICGEGFGLVYNPEFIALGSVIHDFLNPDFVLIGASDPLSQCLIEAVYERVCNNPPQIAVMSRINAEITKLALNSYITTKITFANLLCRLCQNIPGANVDVVTSALGKDSRIGSKYLKGAVSYGGPCFPRDNRALATLIPMGYGFDLPSTVDQCNREHLEWLARIVRHVGIPPITVLGMSYKPGTDVTEESPGVALVKILNQLLPGMIQEKNAKTVVVMQPDKNFEKICYSGLTVIDCWRFLPHLADDPTVNYVPLGVGPCVN